MQTPKAWYNNASGLSPRANGQPPGTSLGNNKEVWPSIGAVLKPYLSGDPEEVWPCPAAPSSPDDNWALQGDNPMTGTTEPDIFKPNYFYMATASWVTLGDSGNGFRSNVWASRNAANLPISSIPHSGSEVLLFVDESTSHHTNSTNIYTQSGPQDHYSNFGYADGHVEGKRVRTVDGYIDALPPAIPQTQFGIIFESALPSQYE
jgi:prepilin-type processing-associated H-X9-DG protein